MQINEMYRTINFYSATLSTGISYNSVNDSPEIIHDAWRDCSCSLATLCIGPQVIFVVCDCFPVMITRAAKPANHNALTFYRTVRHALWSLHWWTTAILLAHCFDLFVIDIKKLGVFCNIVLITIHLCSPTLFVAYDQNWFCCAAFSCMTEMHDGISHWMMQWHDVQSILDVTGKHRY